MNAKEYIKLSPEQRIVALAQMDQFETDQLRDGMTWYEINKLQDEIGRLKRSIFFMVLLSAVIFGIVEVVS